MTDMAASVPIMIGERRPRRRALLLLLAAILAAVFLLAIGTGAFGISPGQFLAIVGNRLGIELPWTFAARQDHVLFAIRLPRVLLAVLIGSGLAVSGALMQGLFRNPLADPSLIGTSGGAALGTVTIVVFGGVLVPVLPPAIARFALPVAAFVGGLFATVLVYRIAALRERTPLASMLLSGIAINSLAGAVVGLLLYVANDAQIRTVTFWSMGSLGGATWEYVWMTAPMVIAGLAIAPRLTRGLNALLLGEAEAEHLGINVAALKRTVIILSAMVVGAAVSVAGIIGFVGLVAPHVIRLILGPDHRGVVPGSALLGAALLVGADLVARTAAAPADLPIGIITALIGAPMFLWLIFRQKSTEGGV